MHEVKVLCSNTQVFGHGVEHDQEYVYLNDDVWDWFETTLGTSDDVWDIAGGDFADYWVFIFSKPRDAMLFKLTWGGV